LVLEALFFYKNTINDIIILFFVLNACLVPALLVNFGIGPCAFFCLALVPALSKTFDFSPSVHSQLKKIQN